MWLIELSFFFWSLYGGSLLDVHFVRCPTALVGGSHLPEVFCVSPFSSHGDAAVAAAFILRFMLL